MEKILPNRSRNLAALLSAAALTALSGAAALAADPAATPAQPKGPFYPLHLPAEQDADLASVAGKQARGEPIVVTGRVLRRDGTPVGNAQVEIWQTNAYGRYHHEHDDSPAPYDPGFQGWGRTTTDAAGRYRFRSVKPIAYSGRAPHIHFAVTAPGGRAFYTQLYLADAAENGRDFLYARLSRAEQAQLAVRLEPAAGGQATARFDIVLP